ncbi:MAG: hypothetical protein LC808_20720, partial [Actinobacteria bacterium]|nr:hypothetical protein [Actinomycetota bacterium]
SASCWMPFSQVAAERRADIYQYYPGPPSWRTFFFRDFELPGHLTDPQPLVGRPAPLNRNDALKLSSPQRG